MAKIDTKLFTVHEHALERDHGDCPDCGKPLLLKHGKHGSFLGCSGYPSCEYHRPLVEKSRTDDEIIEGSSCPTCSLPLALKSGRYGFYIGCSGYPECDYIVKEGEEQTEQESFPACPQCHKGSLTSRTNRFGKRFFACDNYPKCKYVVNDHPVAQTCPDCGWQLLVEKKVRGSRKLCCPQRTCKYQSEPL